MLNQSGIKTTKYAGPTQILANVDLQFSMGCVVSSALGTKQDDGRTIVFAGTPVYGDLNARTTPFAAASAETGATGVLLHDVDVTYGDANATLLIFGFVNTNRLKAEVASLITEDVKTALNAKITFVKA